MHGGHTVLDLPHDFLFEAWAYSCIVFSFLFVFNYPVLHPTDDETVAITTVGVWMVDDLEMAMVPEVVGCAVCFVRSSLIVHDTGGIAMCVFYSICF
jgi:hypothetical protein